MKTIDREELKDKIDSGEKFKLVMTLNTWAFDAAHIPGSINIHDLADIQEYLSPDDEVIVYCSNPHCIASIYAYRGLITAGYKNTRRYPGGIEDWIEAGYPVEGTAST